jgi:hypothetical protein
MRLGVGGGKGLRELTTADEEAPALPEPVRFFGWEGVSNVMDLINVTWHISGYKSYR